VLVEDTVVKETKDHYIEMCRVRKCVEVKDFAFTFSESEHSSLSKSYRSIKWTTNPYVTGKDIREKRYKEKRVFYLQGKIKGETMIGWHTTVKY
jgi:hypothetical protein